MRILVVLSALLALPLTCICSATDLAKLAKRKPIDEEAPPEKKAKISSQTHEEQHPKMSPLHLGKIFDQHQKEAKAQRWEAEIEARRAGSALATPGGTSHWANLAADFSVQTHRPLAGREGFEELAEERAPLIQRHRTAQQALSELRKQETDLNHVNQFISRTASLGPPPSKPPPPPTIHGWFRTTPRAHPPIHSPAGWRTRQFAGRRGRTLRSKELRLANIKWNERLPHILQHGLQRHERDRRRWQQQIPPRRFARPRRPTRSRLADTWHRFKAASDETRKIRSKYAGRMGPGRLVAVGAGMREAETRQRAAGLARSQSAGGVPRNLMEAEARQRAGGLPQNVIPGHVPDPRRRQR